MEDGHEQEGLYHYREPRAARLEALVTSSNHHTVEHQRSNQKVRPLRLDQLGGPESKHLEAELTADCLSQDVGQSQGD